MQIMLVDTAHRYLLCWSVSAVRPVQQHVHMGPRGQCPLRFAIISSTARQMCRRRMKTVPGSDVELRLISCSRPSSAFLLAHALDSGKDVERDLLITLAAAC